MVEDARYAVLIDAENVSPKYVQIIFDEVSNYGITTYRRIYGDWTSTRNNHWKSVLLENSITPIQQYSYTDGKNSSDSALIIDAMDILYTLSVDGFVFVSSDSDFTRLASRLRESGMKVIGMGEAKTPTAFISACNTFKYLDILYEQSLKETDLALDEGRGRAEGPAESGKILLPAKSQVKKEEKKTSHGQGQGGQGSQKSGRPGKASGSGANQGQGQAGRPDQPQPQTKLKTIRRALKSIIQENSDEDDWISLANLGNQLTKRFPDFDVRNYGFSKLAPFVEFLDDFEVKGRQTGADGSKQLFVRIR